MEASDSLKNAAKSLKDSVGGFGSIISGISNSLNTPEFLKYKESLSDEDNEKLNAQLRQTAKDLALSMEVLGDISKFK
jgi:hypothetical protein